MANYTNHLIDPTYFFDAIEEFSFTYDIYVKVGETQDEYHRIKTTYDKQSIRGSLQSQGLNFSQKKEGNRYTNDYNFYCKSLYRIDIGDFIHYKNLWLYVKDVHEYDEWGVREASLEMVQLSAYKDLRDYVAYLKGEKII